MRSESGVMGVDSWWRWAAFAAVLLFVGAGGVLSACGLVGGGGRTLGSARASGEARPVAVSRGWDWVRDDRAVVPEPREEFRGVWVATVVNIDWPSAKALPAETQRDEAVELLDLFVEVGLNAVVLQVRPAADTLYPSRYEPWSEFLSGVSGQPPRPFYDPLRFWMDAAHERGLDVHLWINPYRARHFRETGASHRSRVGVAEPGIVREHGDYLWMDPGEAGAQRRTLNIVRELLTNYRPDGIHIDDYFYPYPGDEGGFDDDASFARARLVDPSLDRSDWRRENVNRLVREIDRLIEARSPHTLFGISPFGIWRPGHPEGVRGFDAYEGLAADARLWLREGWVDYLAPQLYWPIESEGQPFEPLLDWWRSQDVLGRHIWPGLYTSRINADGTGWSPDQIVRQIERVRADGAERPGHIHFSAVALKQNRQDLATRLKARVYAEPAVVPPSEWLDTPAIPAPYVSVSGETVSFRRGAGHPAAVSSVRVRRWLVQTREGHAWTSRVLGPEVVSVELPAGASAVAVRVIGPNGLRSEPVVHRRVGSGRSFGR